MQRPAIDTGHLRERQALLPVHGPRAEQRGDASRASHPFHHDQVCTVLRPLFTIRHSPARTLCPTVPPLKLFANSSFHALPKFNFDNNSRGTWLTRFNLMSFPNLGL